MDSISDTIFTARRFLLAAQHVFANCSTAGKVELCCLASILVCMLGSLGKFPSAINLAVALLGLISCRSRSDAQHLAMVLYSALSCVLDVVFMCNYPSGWGSLLTVVNLIPKLAAGMYAFHLSHVLSGESDGLAVDDRPEAFPTPTARMHLAGEDYESLATEALEKHSLAAAGSNLGDSTNYHAI